VLENLSRGTTVSSLGRRYVQTGQLPDMTRSLRGARVAHVMMFLFNLQVIPTTYTLVSRFPKLSVLKTKMELDSPKSLLLGRAM
jgi:hypothetical protein